ncbi:MAG: LysR family transcriptional regulator [Deltaproteobacteria bacterium]|nr:LysR family transcriptional regulator [Deltaproteobacteria bacterium]
MSDITLEQARTLDAVVRLGSFAKAAHALHKVHSAVIYGIKGLEAAVGLPLFDRSGYRAALTPLGQRVHAQCVRLLEAERELAALCEAARAGFEPTLRVVFDGLLPVAPILAAVRKVTAVSPRTRVSLSSEFLADVEARAEREQAEVMITVVPPLATIGPEVALPELASWLVCGERHPLAGVKRLRAEHLEAHPFLTVRASDQRLTMSTSSLDKASEFKLGDFHAKRQALLAGMGWGWMPSYMIEDDVARGRLVVLAFGPTRGRHTFRPVLQVRRAAAGGRAVEAFATTLAARLGPT